MKTVDDKIVEFCTSVKTGFGTITDNLVKAEFERIYETSLKTYDLGKLLALLEKHRLLDKRFSINKDEKFYQYMYHKLNNPK